MVIFSDTCLFNYLQIFEVLKIKSEEELFLLSSNKGIISLYYRKFHINRATILVVALIRLILIVLYTLMAINVINIQVNGI